MTEPANDAHLIQIVRSALGRKNLLRGVNVSSCGFVVTLHGTVWDEGMRKNIVAVVRSVEGVGGVVDKLRCNERGISS